MFRQVNGFGVFVATAARAAFSRQGASGLKIADKDEVFRELGEELLVAVSGRVPEVIVVGDKAVHVVRLGQYALRMIGPDTSRWGRVAFESEQAEALEKGADWVVYSIGPVSDQPSRLERRFRRRKDLRAL